MPRPRKNDPLGVSDDPVVVTDPERVEAVAEEFKRRLACIERNFIFARKLLGDPLAFNRSLRRLKHAVAGNGTSAMRKRLHLELEIVVCHFARRNAAKRTGAMGAPVIEDDVERAAFEAAQLFKLRRGRPADAVLVHHVEALMAAIQQATGRPVRANRQKNSTYEPYIEGAAGRVMLTFFQRLDPSVTETRLADIIEKARRRYAGKRMRFTDFFPLYGGTIDPETGMPVAGPGYLVESFEPSFPIYSR